MKRIRHTSVLHTGWYRSPHEHPMTRDSILVTEKTRNNATSLFTVCLPVSRQPATDSRWTMETMTDGTMTDEQYHGGYPIFDSPSPAYYHPFSSNTGMPPLQRPQDGGVLPQKTLDALNDLVDRLNSSYNPNDGSQLNVLAILVGTNSGVPLSRSYGSIHTPQQSAISDEILSSIETRWATLPSAIHPHLRNGRENPPHPLVSHLGLGDHTKVSMAFYDHGTLVHIHLAPLVVTVLATVSANVGAIQNVVPFLTELLEPVKKTFQVIKAEYDQKLQDKATKNNRSM